MSEQRAVIIYNPMSGRPRRRADAVQRMIALLKTRGIRAEARATAGPEDATRMARESVSDGIEMIITYGGDGTINEVIQGMAHSNAALAVWPGGTSNVTAVELGMPFTLERLADVFAARKTQRITLGCATGAAGRYFLMMAGIGLDASIAHSVDKKLKRRVGELAYWVSGIKHLFTWSADQFTIT